MKRIQKKVDVEEFVKQIQKSQHILILPHVMPDGDTIGSSIALYLALKELGKDVYILLDEEIPDSIKFLPCENIHKALDENFEIDAVVAVDSSDLERLGKRRKYIDMAKVCFNIDHHITSTYFADYNLVNPKAAATSEIVYFVMKELGVCITKDMATCLYTALSTDTGSFKYDNTTAQTLEIASKLLACNIDLNKITTEVYQNKSLSKVKLLIEALNTLEFFFEGKVAILSVTKDMLEKTGSKVQDTSGLIETARDIEGVEVSVLLKELSDDQIKVGFRSKYDVDVSEISSTFHGGGHKKAAGCTLNGNIESAKEKIITKMKKYL